VKAWICPYANVSLLHNRRHTHFTGWWWFSVTDAVLTVKKWVTAWTFMDSYSSSHHAECLIQAVLIESRGNVTNRCWKILCHEFKSSMEFFGRNLVPSECIHSTMMVCKEICQLNVSGWYENELLKKIFYGFFDLCVKYLAIGPVYLPQLWMKQCLHSTYLHTVMDN